MKAYISHPYRAPTIEGIEANIKAAEEYAFLLSRMANGVQPVVPHIEVKNKFGVSVEFNEGDKDKEISKFCMDLLDTCSMLYVCGPQPYSQGMLAEIEHAQKAGISIAYVGIEWLLTARESIKAIDPDYANKTK